MNILVEKDPIKAANHYLAEGRRLVRAGDYIEGMAMFDSGLLRLNSARRLVSTPERREGRNEHYGANLEGMVLPGHACFFRNRPQMRADEYDRKHAYAVRAEEGADISLVGGIGRGLVRRRKFMGAEVNTTSNPCMTEIYLHIYKHLCARKERTATPGSVRWVTIVVMSRSASGHGNLLQM